MNEDYQELIRRLFTMATELLEDLHPDACRGQSGKLSPKQYSKHAKALSEGGLKISALADTIAVVLTQTSRH